jgi:actin-like ATPase involved in cell morphogenesis
MDTASRTAAALGVDFGTHHTVATVLRDDGRRHQLLFEGSPLLPSGIYIDNESSLHVGRDAAREGRRRPERYERNPKLRLDGATILLGDQEVPVREAVAAVLRRVIGECSAVAGAPRSVTITVPAGWGPARRHVIGDAAGMAGAASPVLLPEPVAAARYFVEVLGRELAVGQALVVFDLGAGTFDASAVARTGDGFEVLAVDGSDRIGGHYLDQALVDHLGGRFTGTGDRAARWRALLDPDGDAERLRQRFALYDEVREAKERLSRHSSTEIAVPGFAAEELLTRAELDLLARPLLAQAVEITKAVIREAGFAPERLAGLFMVGGASRMPLAATMVHQELGIAPTLIEQPELVVSEGAVAIASTPAPPSPVPAPPTARQASAPTTRHAPAAPAAPTGIATPEPVRVPSPAAWTSPLPPLVPPAPEPDRNGLAALIVAVVVVLLIGCGALLAELVGRGQGEGSGDGATEIAASDPASDDEPSVPDLYDGEVATDWAEVEIVEVQTTASSITVATNAATVFENCLADIHSSSSEVSEFNVSVPCDQFTLHDLWASDSYEIRVYRENPYDDGIAATAETEAITGEVYWDCPDSRKYCRDQGGEPGIRETYTVADSTIDTAPVGSTFALNCYEVGETITPRGEEDDGYWDYHPHKDASDLMIQVELPDDETGYIPFVWLVIDPDDPNSLGGLPPCRG